MYSTAAEVATLVWALALSCWRSVDLFFPDERDLFVLSVSLMFSRTSWNNFRWFSWMHSSNFCLFKSWVVQRSFPERGWSFRSKFLPQFLAFITQGHTVLMSVLIFTVYSQYSLVNSGRSFIFAHPELVKSSLFVCFTRLRMSHPFWKKCIMCTEKCHAENWSQEPWTCWHKFAPYGRGTCAEVLFLENPKYFVHCWQSSLYLETFGQIKKMRVWYFVWSQLSLECFQSLCLTLFEPYDVPVRSTTVSLRILQQGAGWH